MSNSNRIDVHHHYIPPKFAKAVAKFGNAEWPTPKWNLSASQAIMKTAGISTSILSVTSPWPEVATSVDEQIEIARDANDSGASIRDATPASFGFFATIPDPVTYPDAAMAELTRALDELNADGVTLMTSYRGKYLGNEAFAPLWSEINRRKAVAFVHPTSPPEPYKPVNATMLPPVVDFTFETSKTAYDLITSGTITRNPDVKIILSHGGGTLPWTWHRVAQLPKAMSLSDISYEQIRDQAKNFYFDTALTGWGENIKLLLDFANEGHVLYGSDFPYAPNDVVEAMTQGLDEVLNVDKMSEMRIKVNFGNAMKLFPRLGKANN